MVRLYWKGGVFTAKHDRDSELILGLITTVGTEINDVVDKIKNQLAFFHYTPEEIVVSKEIISQFESEPFHFGSEFERVNHYMDLGNNIRESAQDKSILMKGIASFLR